MKKTFALILALMLCLAAAVPAFAEDNFTIFDADSAELIVVSAPTKTTYAIGEELDLTGFALQVRYDGTDTEDVTSAYTVTGFDSSTAGVQTLTVTFAGLTATFDVTVESGVTRGDVNGDNVVNSADAIYLLRHTMRPSRYPINQSGDMNGDNAVNSADAIYLLRHTMRPARYPLAAG